MTKQLQQISNNLANAALRYEHLHGKKYLVAPVAMLTEGVHNGSRGPLLYRKENIGKHPPAWNMRPVVVYHPEINGEGVSACDPGVLETHQVGMLMNARWDNKLRAETWLDEGRCAQVDPRVLDALESNKVMEVSTGLFTDNEAAPTGATWGGKPYEYEATNPQPDHLALLPDKKGACSVADGAGLLQLNEAAAGLSVDLAVLLGPALDYARRVVGNAMSHDQLREALSKALRPGVAVPPIAEIDDFWIVDVFPASVVYHQDGSMWRRAYKLAKGSKAVGVELLGTREEVMRQTSYVPVANSSPGYQYASAYLAQRARQAAEAYTLNHGTPGQKGYPHGGSSKGGGGGGKGPKPTGSHKAQDLKGGDVITGPDGKTLKEVFDTKITGGGRSVEVKFEGGGSKLIATGASVPAFAAADIGKAVKAGVGAAK